MMKRSILILSVSVLLLSTLTAESLVPDNFAGFLRSDGSLSPGTIIRVLINSETRMSFSSTSGSNTSIVLNFSGGEGGSLLNFLPTGSSTSSAAASGEEESLLETEFAARVTEVDAQGGFYLRGSREIRFDRGFQRVEVEGWGTLSAVDEEGRIPFNSLADAVLSYTTLTGSGEAVLAEADLEEPAVEPPVPDETAAVDETGEGPAPAAEVPDETLEPQAPIPLQPQTGELALTEEVRRDLLLQYMNQMIDLLFTPPVR
jgi:flagellar basal body L-ring protein FlgH